MKGKCCQSKRWHGSREHGGEGAAVRRQRQHKEVENEIFRIAGEVDMGGHEDESEIYEESRSGDGEQESTKLYSKVSIQKERELWLLKEMFQEAVWSSTNLKGKSSWSRKSCAIQPDGDRTRKLHAEWSSVHDKIVHREGIIKELKEQLEKDEIHEQEAKDKREEAAYRKACKLETLQEESEHIEELQEEPKRMDAKMCRRLSGRTLPTGSGSPQANDEFWLLLINNICKEQAGCKYVRGLPFVHRASGGTVGATLPKALLGSIFGTTGAGSEAKRGNATDRRTGYHAKPGSNVALDGVVTTTCSPGC